jgi:hypothetical protein
MVIPAHARLIALLVGLLGGLLAFAGITAIIWLCASMWGRSLGNANAGDSFGWAFLIAVPLLAAAVLGTSIAVGVLAHNKIRGP